LDSDNSTILDDTHHVITGLVPVISID